MLSKPDFLYWDIFLPGLTILLFDEAKGVDYCVGNRYDLNTVQSEKHVTGTFKYFQDSAFSVVVGRLS